MKKILLTGFGPFKDFDTNPTTLLVTSFPELDGVICHKAILEVNENYIRKEYPKILAQIQPEIIINTGLNAKACGLQLETFAINSLKDKNTHTTIGSTAAFHSLVDTHTLAQTLCQKGIPVQRSDYAGSYYCNYVYYLSLQWGNPIAVPSLFVHIPFFTEMMPRIIQEKQQIYPSLPQSLIQKGLENIIKVLLSPYLPT